MADKARSNFAGASIAGITDELGNSIVSPDTTGGTAQLLGSVAQRVVSTKVANGFFGLIPADGTAVISEDDNPLPYWTLTRNGTAVTCKVVADSNSATGNVLRFSIAAGATGTATISAFVNTDGTRGHYHTALAQAGFGSAVYTGSPSINAAGTSAFVSIAGVGYKDDQTTVTGGTVTTSETFSNIATTVNGDALVGVVADYANSAASYFAISVSVYATASHTAVRTIDCRFVQAFDDVARILALPDTSLEYSPAATIRLASEGGAGSLYVDSPVNTTLTTGATDRVKVNTSEIAALYLGTTVDTTVMPTNNLVNGIVLRRTADLSIGTGDTTSATAITWSTAVSRPPDNTGVAAGTAYWTTGSSIVVPYDGLYLVSCHLRFGTGTAYGVTLFAYAGSTMLAETNVNAGLNTVRDTVALSTVRKLTAGDSIVFRARATTTGKSILTTTTNNSAQVVYLGNHDTA